MSAEPKAPETNDRTSDTSRRVRASAFADSTPCLVLLSTPLGDRVFPLAGERVTIGGASDCAFRLEHPLLADVAIEIVRRDGAWHARNLRADRGVLVNGAEMRERRLRPGDAIDVILGSLYFSDRHLG